jgi:hypothetical protein
MMFAPTIVCADIGSVRGGNYGWWSSCGEHGSKPTGLATHVATLLNGEHSVALGFECPLFVPLVEDELELTRARPGEEQRPWSAGAGCGVLATGLVQAIWTLAEIRKRLSRRAPATLDWPFFRNRQARLFLWEAFVTGTAKLPTHEADAEVGAKAFMQALPDPTTKNAVVCKSAVHSLIGAALLRSGWSSDLSLLEKPCVVIRANANAL